MNNTAKKLLILAALVMSAAVAVPAWSEDQAAEPAGEAAAPASPETSGSTDASAPAPAGEAAVAGAPEDGAAAAPAPAGDDGAASGNPAADNSGYVERNYHPFDWLIYNPLWAATGVIGDFNPVGNYVTAPLEQATDGRLKYKGFINNITMFNTTGNQTLRNASGAETRYKDWLLSKQEVRISNEVKYQATDHLEFVTVGNFQWDGAYTQASRGIIDSGAPNQVYYSQLKRILREAYVKGDWNGRYGFTLGKQIVNWGKMDGKVLDFINASDGRDAIVTNITDYEWRAIGQWMGLFTVRPIETVTVNFLVNPDFQPNVPGAPGNPWYSPWSSYYSNGQLKLPAVAAEDHPYGFQDLSQVEWGVRVDSTIGGDLVLSAIYHNGFDRDGVQFGKTADGINHHTRLNRYGVAGDWATNIYGQRLGIRTEALYINGKAFRTSDPAAANGIAYKDQVKFGTNFETSVGSDEDKYDFTYTINWTTQLGYDSRTGSPRNQVTHIPTVSHSVHATSDKLVLTAGAYITGGSKDNGMSWYTSGTWRFNDFLTAKLQYNDYLGNNTDGTNYGGYYAYKNIVLDVKYEW